MIKYNLSIDITSNNLKLFIMKRIKILKLNIASQDLRCQNNIIFI